MRKRSEAEKKEIWKKIRELNKKYASRLGYTPEELEAHDKDFIEWVLDGKPGPMPIKGKSKD